MPISPETIQRVRDAADIVEIIDSYVPLKRSGSGYKALSPFNKERTPSFNVNPQKQIFKCFSSGHGGDVFKFLMLYENLEFPEAVRRVAERVGIEIEEERGPGDGAARQKRSRLLTLHAEVMKRWRQALLHDPAAEGARAYLESRQIPLGWVEEYDLGYAPNTWDDALNWARAKGYHEEELLAAGLVVKNETGRIYDRFRDRLVFAIHDDTGQVIGFSARALDPEVKGAKYINSPETPLFNKSRVLFGFHRAKRDILDADSVVLCEGQIDVLRCHAVGIGNVVAPLGTAFTEEHAKILGRHARSVILCLDADRAGRQAAARAAETLLDLRETSQAFLGKDLGFRVVSLPAGHDPDSLIREEGVDAFRMLLEKPQEFIDFFIYSLEETFPGDEPAIKRRKAQAVAEFLVKIPNLSLQEQLTYRGAEKLGVSFKALRAEFPQKKKVFGKKDSTLPEAPSQEGAAQVHPTIKEFLGLLLNFPDEIPGVQHFLACFPHQILPGQEILEKMISLYNDDAWQEATECLDFFDGPQRTLLEETVANFPEHLDETTLQQALLDLGRRCCYFFVEDQLSEIEGHLKTGDNDSKRTLVLLQRKSNILRYVESLKSKNSLTAMGDISSLSGSA